MFCDLYARVGLILGKLPPLVTAGEILNCHFLFKRLSQNFQCGLDAERIFKISIEK